MRKNKRFNEYDTLLEGGEEAAAQDDAKSQPKSEKKSETSKKESE